MIVTLCRLTVQVRSVDCCAIHASTSALLIDPSLAQAYNRDEILLLCDIVMFCIDIVHARIRNNI